MTEGPLRLRGVKAVGNVLPIPTTAEDARKMHEEFRAWTAACDASRTYRVRFIHKISPRDTDIKSDVQIPDGAFADRNALGAALRAAGVLDSGHRVRSFRTEGDKVIAFPSGACNIWHSIIIERS
jgi:hypothetical protein